MSAKVMVASLLPSPPSFYFLFLLSLPPLWGWGGVVVQKFGSTESGVYTFGGMKYVLVNVTV
jgi:hypothetical protein